MVVHSNAQLHHARKKNKKFNTQSPTRSQKLIDTFIYAAVVMGPIMTLPQVIKIWVNKNASGVSFVSWTSFSVLSLVWITYGIIHKEKPIIYMNLALVIAQSLVALGAFIYG